MKKAIKYILIVFGIYAVIMWILSFLGVFKLYNSPTTANSPGLKLKAKFYSSNLLSPMKGDFVCFIHNDSIGGDHTRVYRLIAIEGDTLEIKNGIVYLNNDNFDKEYNLCHSYTLSNNKFDLLHKQDLIDENLNRYPLSLLKYRKHFDSMTITFEDKIADSLGLTSLRQIDSTGKKNKHIFNTFNKNWNKDNFGPLIINKNKFFVLGDNRDNAEDSRYIGLIDKSDLKGTVVLK